MRILNLILFFTIPSLCYSHGGKVHREETVILPSKDAFIDIYKQVNDDYIRQVEPIFQAKCFNCHSLKTNYPWYYKLPGAKQIINDHIKEALGHLDMTEGFPFKGHETPIKDLEALKKTIQNDSMPPWYYRIFHEDSSVTDQEKELIFKWIDSSLEKLRP